MADEIIYLTQDALDQRKRERDEAVARRTEIAQRLKEAREQGDLSENSEYDAAKEEQEQNESKIHELEFMISHAQVVTADEIDEFGTIHVNMGCVVTVTNDKGDEVTYNIVSPMDTDSLKNMISTDSPLGAALSGHVAGDTVSFTTPSGRERTFTIKTVELA